MLGEVGEVGKGGRDVNFTQNDTVNSDVVVGNNGYMGEDI